MRVRSSLKVAALQWTLVAAVIHPCLLAVLSMLKAWRGWIDQDGRRRSWTKEGSIKFPVALQSMRAVAATVLNLYCSQMGNQIAYSDLSATSTEAMTEEEGDIATPSCSKKTPLLFHWHQWRVGGDKATQQAFSPFLPILSCISQVLLPP